MIRYLTRMKGYNHTEIEKKWQKWWTTSKTYTTPDSASGKENFYLLVEFPYPSGNLHVGHWYAFAVPDILVRFHRMTGKNVLFPIGFDAFGLPAENAAIKNKLNPRDWTEKNIAYMTKQIESMGTSFDWSRKVSTIDPTYYKWTQWLFLQLYKKGLVYQKETAVNWCPSCMTVLANEQVVPSPGQASVCERCGTEVVQKQMLQWNIKITDYADRLIDDLPGLDWPEQIKESQRNWIGRSEGAEIDFFLDFADESVNARVDEKGKRARIAVFTTRPDTLFGATYLVLAPEHPLLRQGYGGHAWDTFVKNANEVAAYIKTASKKTELERMMDTKDPSTGSGLGKTGVRLEGVSAVNPATGEKIPMYVADYVFAHYGTGAIMAVPAHDERDYEFAMKFGLPTREVIRGDNKKPWTGEGVLVNSGEFDGMDSESAKGAFAQRYGRVKKTYRLRDWIVSRQRYWGVPIPIIHCERCGAQPVPEKSLPVELPVVEDYLPDGNGMSPLAKVKSFVQTTCPKCGEKARRETDTLDTFIDSSWYFLRYTDPRNNKTFASKAKMAHWLPVDLYSGGAEHTTMHLLYSRFWHKALYDLNFVADKEPYKRRMNRSIVLGPDGRKMSKSHGNVVDPDEVVERLGADTVRMYLAFIGPYSEVSAFPWNQDGVVGVRRFLERVWRLSEKERGGSDVRPLLHKVIKKVGEDIPAQKFNTAISQLMILLNDFEPKKQLSEMEWSIFLRLLAPFAPHMAEELWSQLGNASSIHLEMWPEHDASKLVDDETAYAVQIDGKTRGEVRLAADADRAEVERAAREAIAPRLEGREVARVIFVPGRLINFVLK